MLYWKCKECDESNPYPFVRFCETCGAEIPASSDQKLSSEMRRREKIEEERRQKALEEIRITLLEKKREIRKNREKKIFSRFGLISKYSSRALMIITLLTIAVTGALCYKNEIKINFSDYLNDITNKVSYTFESGRQISKNNDRKLILPIDDTKEKIRSEYTYVSESFHPIENIKAFFEEIFEE